MKVIVKPDYASIQPVRDLIEPWLEIWGGDEWGDSMRALHAAAHVDYGFSDEDCALFANKLLEYLFSQKTWIDEEGKTYGLSTVEQEREAKAECRKTRDYWLNGGNLGDKRTIATVRSTIKKLPDWMFEE